MKKLESFIKIWGLHMCCAPGIVAFLCMALNNYVNEEQTLVYILGAGITLLIYLFFWCERINIELLEKYSHITVKQQARQRELIDALRSSDHLLYEQSKLIEVQSTLMDEILK